MSHATTSIPKKRIGIIDALRGFALMGILILHCTEHFELFTYPDDSSSPALHFLNIHFRDTVQFLFMGKAYAIFSLMFGLSFFIQMNNQSERGIDFRLRFAWRMVLLFALGTINGMFYSGEIFVVYAVLGLILIPAYKIPSRWLWPVCLLLLLKLPVLIQFFCTLFDPELAAAGAGTIKKFSWGLYPFTQEGYAAGTFGQVLSRNLWEAQFQKWIWYFHTSTYMHTLGFFIAGMLIGRLGIHQDPERMVSYSKRLVLIGLPIYTIFYCVSGSVLSFGFGKEATRVYSQLFTSYANVGMMMILIGMFVLTYFRLNGQQTLHYLAPVGRMSLTNYMAQSIMGSFIFYGYGLGMGVQCGQFYSTLIGLVLCTIQIMYSNWWMKRYYYGPAEWLWRSATWLSMQAIPFRRKAA